MHHFLAYIMGFDFAIQLSVSICDETGKPYYYGKDPETNRFRKIYALPDVIVPEEHRRFLKQRGGIYHIYTQYFNEYDIYQVDIHTFLRQFPKWETVKEHDLYSSHEDYWNEDEHAALLGALHWFAIQGESYSVSWSY
jgi:hypothetical protein